MEIRPPDAHKKTGRPLSFNRDAALQKAKLLFWRHGYEATSLNDLTDAMGVTPPSIYAAFGNKKGLFLEAVRLYLSDPLSPQEIMDAEPTARAAAQALMEGAAATFTNPATPPGCMLATSAISVSAAAADVQAELASLRNGVEAHLRERIERAQAEGELSADIDAEALAAHTTAVIQGMSTLARDGAGHDKLMRVVALAMRAWD
jgi:AcrR family transcriptional regulator